MPQRAIQGGAAARCGRAGRRHPEGAGLARGRVEAYHGGATCQIALGPGLGGIGQQGLGGASGQAVEREVGRGVGQPSLGTQHEHGQALERGSQQVARADQQHLAAARSSGPLEADEAGLHAPLGGQERRQAGVLQAQQGEVLGQLAVQESGGVIAFDADHAQMGQGGGAFQRRGQGKGHAEL